MSPSVSGVTKDLLSHHVFPNLDGHDLLVCLRVCKLWNQAASDEKLWKELCHGIVFLTQSPITWKKEYLASLSFSHLFKSEPKKHILTGHSHEIKSTAIDNRILVSVDAEFQKFSSICVWDLSKKTCLNNWEDSSVDRRFSLRGERVAFLKFDNRFVSMFFWNWRTNLTEHFSVNCGMLPVSLRGDVVCLARLAPSVLEKLLNWVTNEEIPLPPIENPDSFWLNGDLLIVSTCDEHQIKVFNWKTKQSLSVLQGHQSTILSTALEGNILVSGSQDGTVRVWDWPKNTCLMTIEGKKCIEGYEECHFWTVSVALRGFLVAFAVPRPTLQIWNWHTGQRLMTFEETSGLNVLFYKNSVISSHGKNIHIWTFERQNLVKKIKNKVIGFFSNLGRNER